MKLIKTPVKGMNDVLPREERLRQKALSAIRETYAAFGFDEVETPAVEHIENLTGKEGGENEKLIFRVMKRGAELARAMEKGDELADSGLRYDLTLPLARLYAANKDSLPAPFKALQMGPVWRADRPQKGRFRQFTQCDIDILGDPSSLAEIELISATSLMLTKLFEGTAAENFTVHINDRRILRAMALYAGFPEDRLDLVFILLDKLDKIGKEGVKEEMLREGFEGSAADKYLALFDRERAGSVADFCAFLTGQALEEAVPENLDTIIACVRAAAPANAAFVFDPTLVRGMGYYTGPIFEVTLDAYSFSIAGGGRYDKMIGRFAGQDTPACGFSIGFERIITILGDMEQKSAPAGNGVALLVENGASGALMQKVFAEAASLRAGGKRVTVLPLKKNAKFQIDVLMEEGYGDVRRIYKDQDR